MADHEVEAPRVMGGRADLRNRGLIVVEAPRVMGGRRYPIRR